VAIVDLVIASLDGHALAARESELEGIELVFLITVDIVSRISAEKWVVLAAFAVLLGHQKGRAK
jgi:hypothetical protein